MSSSQKYFVHESSYVDDNVKIGTGTHIWHFSHILSGAVIGKNCNIGQNACIAGDVIIGNNVKIQNNVSVYTGTIIENDVFLGPSCVLTNVSNPRSQVSRKNLYEKTRIRTGATIGANATVVCGLSIGCYAFVAAGAVVTKDIPDYCLVAGTPAKKKSWISRHGHKLQHPDKSGTYVCPESGLRYTVNNEGGLYCIDLAETEPLPAALSTGRKTYRYFTSKE